MQKLLSRLFQGAHKSWHPQSTKIPCPSLSFCCQNVPSGRTRSGGGQDSHSFPAPGGRNTGYSSDNLLLMLLIVLFCPSEKRLPYFNCSSQLPVRLTTLQLTTSRIDFFICLSGYPAPQQWRLMESRAAERLSVDSVENPEAQMWIQIGLKNLLRSGFLELPAFSLTSVFDINELSVF